MRRSTLIFITLFSISCSKSSFTGNSPESPTEGNNKAEETIEPIAKSQYIVVFRDSSIQQDQSSQDKKKLVRRLSKLMEKKYTTNTLKSFSRTLTAAVYELTPEMAQKISLHKNVRYVEEDRIISINTVQASPPWGLDRIDQKDLPLSESYKSSNKGGGVNVYVLDTGVLTTHESFDGRAQHGRDTSSNDNDATDCNGHGTHVAGTIGSKDYGVAKESKIIGVRVLDCFGSGRISDIISGVEWVTNNHKKPAVANMSLGGRVSKTIDEAVEASIKAGVTYVVAAGNNDGDACEISPARVPGAITVGSVTDEDERSAFSNHGDCVDIFAPGSDILSSWIGSSDSSTKTISGTSMAAPHVAGVAALYLSKNPEASPEEVSKALTKNASLGKLSSIEDGSPNLLLNINFLNSESETQIISHEDLSARRNQSNKYKIEIADGASQLEVEISGGLGDADLYVRLGSEPTLRKFDCRPYKSRNNEVCTMKKPRAGVAYIMVHAYRDYSGVDLKISVE